MSNINIPESIRQFFKSQQEFPVDILWLVEVGLYANKNEAKRSLSNTGFLKGTDFSAELLKTPQGGRPSESIHLTIDCAQHLCMLSRTNLGMKIRQAFIDTRKAYEQWLRSKAQYQPSRALRAAREINEIHEKVEYISPRLSQYLIDCCVNEVVEQRLPGTNIQLRGVVEIAEEMGFPVNSKNRSSLGKFVKAEFADQVKMEQRLVNGAMREVCCYPDTDDIRARIALFFNQ